MCLTPNMYKIVTVNRQMLRRFLLANAFDTKYVQNHYFADKCSGNHYFKMHSDAPNMYKIIPLIGKCSGNH